jgi:hypothetical protein
LKIQRLPAIQKANPDHLLRVQPVFEQVLLRRQTW